ncbi:MAG: SCO1664 family protein [Actinomycetota bacterium]
MPPPFEPAELESGDLELLGLLPAASNYTFLARLHTEGEPAFVVYKPRRGEAPLWDFPSGTLCQREVAAYLVCRAAGWGFVPPTVLRDGPHGPGAVQAFIPHDFTTTAFDLLAERPEVVQGIVLFDIAVNNADRKAGHVFTDEEGAVWAVDHGICFHEEPKLRTVLWDFTGRPIPPAERAPLELLCRALEGDLAAELEPLLTPAELHALRRRTEAIAGAACFPEPGQGRPYPWPPV